ncbi:MULTISPECIES: ABC transporter substrate-binding protein [Janthinobacterium]|jgi:branched-chain amino acid transport system substrate-binding protein|uniref:ABC transporter substrate-binding protein n=1 Tax=Janthinobacterium agaricidamnosum TaxID=55508 RepID=A0A3G2EGL5_9BURK|nr:MULTISPECIES: ABC transporter substrate-binding protein [Janthinobacterium]AYM79022.1 ABC transporter substrate-binding protein [Janthinobacterium agaricidamnosum]MCC7681525.1 ABC transporter substrate-binding protein [Janthinobacterium sp. FW305-128]OEZ65130.1 receptor family ligand binding region [Janthinobacterium sp. HH100]OEZ84330.1 receptor family ligand binding region [Janthinobacterium sp. HH103]OEZ94975.1 receptor family ligand binding region [Janthinobacterium sp. HH107]
MKRNAIAIATATLCALGFSAAAHAQVSGDTIKIGFISDMSGVYSDVDGLGGAEAIKMAIADAGVVLAGKKVEFISADHQNKADIAASKAREWFDQQGVDMLIGGTNSGASLAMAKVAAEKKKIFIAIGAGSSRLTNEECTPYTVHYAYDTVALARGTGGTIVKQGGKNWYFMTADYAFGHSLEKDTAEVVKAAGGKVLGSVKHPLGASDFSSFLLQAQAAKPQILGLANAGGDAINSIKAANEFGLTKSMKLAGLLIFINDIHSLGLNLTQGMYLTDGWYWDLNPETRAWSKRYFAKMKKEPSMLQAADYSAAANYLKAVKAVGTDDTDKVMAYLKKTKINDMFTQNGEVRPDGRMVHDMYLMEVKKPSESKYPWDYYKVVATVPGAQAYVTKAESKCSLWK